MEYKDKRVQGQVSSGVQEQVSMVVPSVCGGHVVVKSRNTRTSE
jgi:hypothetical protein